MNHLLANYMKRFFSHYLPVQKGLSVNTILAYRDAIKLLLCYAEDTLGRPVDRFTAEDITERVVIEFLDHLEQEAVTRGLNYLFNVVQPTHPDPKGITRWLTERRFEAAHDRLRRQVRGSKPET